MPLRSPRRPSDNTVRCGGAAARGGVAAGMTTGLYKTCTLSCGSTRLRRYSRASCAPSTSHWSACNAARAKRRTAAGNRSNQPEKLKLCPCTIAGTPRSRAARSGTDLRTTLPPWARCTWTTSARPKRIRAADTTMPRTPVHWRAAAPVSTNVDTDEMANRGSGSSTSRRITDAMPPRLSGPAGAGPMVSTRIGLLDVTVRLWQRTWLSYLSG